MPAYNELENHILKAKLGVIPVLVHLWAKKSVYIIKW